MGNRGGPGPQLQMSIPMTPTVKILMIANVSIWLVLQVIIEQYVFRNDIITTLFGLVPELVITKYCQRIYYCAIEGETGQQFAYFEHNLIPPRTDRSPN